VVEEVEGLENSPFVSGQTGLYAVEGEREREREREKKVS